MSPEEAAELTTWLHTEWQALSNVRSETNHPFDSYRRNGTAEGVNWVIEQISRRYGNKQ